MVPALVELALDYYRNPVAYSQVADEAYPLPRGFSKLLAEFGTALNSANIEETADLLSTDVQELEEAARFFARHALLAPIGDYYRYLGLSTDAKPESIRRNYLILIRMFHPDRVKDATDADLAYSSRLNAAYRVLNDPEARAGYDLGLPKSLKARYHADPHWFFQPQLTPVDTLGRNRRQPPQSVLTKRRRIVFATGIALLGALLAVGHLFTRNQPQPMLRLAGHDRIGQGAPMPRYLSETSPVGNAAMPTITGIKPKPAEGAAPSNTKESSNFAVLPIGTAAASAPSTPGMPNARTLATPEPWRAPDQQERLKADRRWTPSQDIPKRPRADKPSQNRRTNSATMGHAATATATERSQPIPPDRPAAPPIPLVAGARLITRLEQAYRRGNADAIAALFTKSARTSDGSGRRLIRSQYAQLFRDVTDQRLVVTYIAWRQETGSRLTGSGRFWVSTKAGTGGKWRTSDGQIDIEIVRAGSNFRISSMLYRLN